MQTDYSGIAEPIAKEAPAASDVRTEMERILSSRHFQASQRRRTFLRFIVEQTLSGRADRLKGYTIATAVFGRDATFDSSADPVVRLEARRLRRDLDSYYVNEGRHDAVRISIPKGNYVPYFEWQDANQAHATPDGEQAPNFRGLAANGASGVADRTATITRALPRSVLIAAVVIVLAIIVAATWVLTADKLTSLSNYDERGPGVVVLPFESLNSNEDSRYLASGISQELVTNLMGFPSFRLYTLPAGFNTNEHLEPAQLGRNLGVAYIVSGSVNAHADEIRVATQTIEAKSGRVLWSHTYDRSLNPEALIGVQRELASEIASVIGQPYGVVRSDLTDRLDIPAVANMQSYVCVLRAYGYRRTFLRTEFDPILKCLQDAVRRDPDYSDAWAMLGWLHVDAGRIGYAGYNTQEEYKKALQAASKAVQLAPHNILALKVLAAVKHYMGYYDESERIAREALEINPHDPETMAQLGWRLAVRGKFEEGIPILKRAITRSVNPPGWYYHLVAIDRYLKKDYEGMRQISELAAVDSSGFTSLLIAVANGELGDRNATRVALKKLSEFEPLARDPAAYMRRHGAVDEIVDSLMAGLKKAERLASAQ